VHYQRVYWYWKLPGKQPTPLASRVERFALASNAEQAELASMQSLVAALRSLIDRASEAQSRRCANR
jgi:hypothetical protein